MTSAKVPSELADLEPATYNAFVSGLELAGIELVKIHGERTAAGVAARTSFDFTATYIQDDCIIHYRYEVIARFVDEHNAVLGSAVASVQVVVRSEMIPSGPCIEQFGATSGSLMAHPYLRESVASTAQRIGFPGVLLPMTKQHPAEPDQD